MFTQAGVTDNRRDWLDVIPVGAAVCIALYNISCDVATAIMRYTPGE